ncbi:hypothetical protein FQZ97_849520 [compost metagenome]
MQGFQQCQQLLFQHAGHQPVAAVVAHLVERKDRHRDRQTIARVARLVQVGAGAVHAAQAQRLGKRLRGDAGRLVAHQLFFGQQQEPGVELDRALVPTLEAGAAAHVGRQLLVVESVNQLVVHQHVLPSRLVFQLCHLLHQLLVRSQERQARFPVASDQRLADEDFARARRVHPAIVGAAVVVDHQPVERGALQRRDARGLLLPVRVEQLLFQ